MKQASLFTDLPAQKSMRPTEPIVRDALIANGCRFWLKRAWGSGPCVLWAMCNPSDANGLRDDPTMWRVMEFSARWGYGSCIVVNPIPHISSTPDVALEWVRRAEMWMVDGDLPTPEWGDWQRNIAHCSRLMLLADAHVAAWGNNLAPDLVRRWMQDLAEATDDGRGGGAFEDDPAPMKWLCLGTNENGSPRHPLSRGRARVPADFKAVSWTLKPAADRA